MTNVIIPKADPNIILRHGAISLTFSHNDPVYFLHFIQHFFTV